MTGEIGPGERLVEVKLSKQIGISRTPIREVDYISVGNGKLGPITQELAALFLDAVHAKQEEYLKWLSFL